MYHISYADGQWSVFEDHEGKINSGISLVWVLKEATQTEPKNTEIYIKFTKSGSNQLRELNP